MILELDLLHRLVGGLQKAESSSRCALVRGRPNRCRRIRNPLFQSASLDHFLQRRNLRWCLPIPCEEQVQQGEEPLGEIFFALAHGHPREPVVANVDRTDEGHRPLRLSRSISPNSFGMRFRSPRSGVSLGPQLVQFEAPDFVVEGRRNAVGSCCSAWCAAR